MPSVRKRDVRSHEQRSVYRDDDASECADGAGGMSCLDCPSCGASVFKQTEDLWRDGLVEDCQCGDTLETSIVDEVDGIGVLEIWVRHPIGDDWSYSDKVGSTSRNLEVNQF